LETFLAKPHIVIISPALAKANNGNWQTANRWARFLQAAYQVTIAPTSKASFTNPVPDAIIALHARRSAAALAAFTTAYPSKPSILVLTGTDLYHDIRIDPAARDSLQLATHLVVLQEEGLQELNNGLREKASVIYQSAPSLKPVDPNSNARYFDVTMIGHLREEKDPATFMRAAGLVSSPEIRLTHIGGALDAALGKQAEATQCEHSHYRWLNNLPHATTRQYLKRSQLMVITSRMEGGANVIIEAVTSGVPVLASDISGNRGMLGSDYAGYFSVGDSHALARMIDQALNDSSLYNQLKTQCAARAPLFSPMREKAAVLELVDNLIN
jgi:putative glycosyltransferase (TIGR04348 family)